MKVTCYLVIQGKKARYQSWREAGNIKVTKKKPSTAGDEIAVRLQLEIPDSLFEKPSLNVNLKIPDSVQVGGEITPEMTDNIAEIIQAQTGLSVTVSAAESDDEHY